MSKQGNNNFYRWLMIIGFVILIVTYALFGWTDEDKHGFARFLELTGLIALWSGLIGDILAHAFSGVTVIKNEKTKHVTHYAPRTIVHEVRAANPTAPPKRPLNSRAVQ
jgi:hypothetical protein